ncbi:MAG TPA: hypothetical protein VF678_05440, partial [bacterium]
IAFLAAAAWYYVKVPSKDRIGNWGLLGLMVLFLAIYFGNIGSIPPNATLVAASGLALWLFTLIAWWVDRRRSQG